MLTKLQSKETWELKIALAKYTKYLDGLSDYLPILERKFVMEKHIKVLVDEVVNDFHLNTKKD